MPKEAYKERKDVVDALNKLAQDRDRDVRYYASTAIQPSLPSRPAVSGLSPPTAYFVLQTSPLTQPFVGSLTTLSNGPTVGK